MGEGSNIFPTLMQKIENAILSLIDRLLRDIEKANYLKNSYEGPMCMGTHEGGYFTFFGGEFAPFEFSRIDCFFFKTLDILRDIFLIFNISPNCEEKMLRSYRSF